MRHHTLLLLSFASLAPFAMAQTKVSDRPSLSSGDLVPGTDILPIVDISAGSGGSKKITINALFTGWGFSSNGASFVKASNYASMTALLPSMSGDSGSGGVKGLVPAPGAGDAAAGKYLKADGTWTVPPGGGMGSGDLLAANNLSELTNFGAARTNLGLAIGTNVQAWDTDLDTWAGKTAPTGTVIGTSDSQTITNKTLGSGTVITAANMTLGSDGTGDVYYRASGGSLTRLAAGSDGQVLTLASGLPSWATPSGGGGGSLTNLTESVNTATPNASVPAVQLIPTNAAANVDIVIAAKGTGALLAQIPDGTTAGGNKRGTRAVDLQSVRNSASSVASGNSSVVAGGHDNTASGLRSAVLGGWTNAASGTASGVLSGQSNTASGSSSSVLGGFSNTASGEFSMASGVYSTARGIYGAEVRATGNFGSAGDAQRSGHILRRSSSSASPVPLSADGSTPTSINVPALPNSSAYKFVGEVIARSSGGDVKSWDISGTIKRGANAAATSLVGTPNVVSVDADTGAAAWSIAVTANTTLGSLEITATGETGKTIRWVANIQIVEVTF